MASIRDPHELTMGSYCTSCGHIHDTDDDDRTAECLCGCPWWKAERTSPPPERTYPSMVEPVDDGLPFYLELTNGWYVIERACRGDEDHGVRLYTLDEEEAHRTLARLNRDALFRRKSGQTTA